MASILADTCVYETMHLRKGNFSYTFQYRDRTFTAKVMKADSSAQAMSPWEVS